MDASANQRIRIAAPGITSKIIPAPARVSEHQLGAMLGALEEKLEKALQEESREKQSTDPQKPSGNSSQSLSRDPFDVIRESIQTIFTYYKAEGHGLLQQWFQNYLQSDSDIPAANAACHASFPDIERHDAARIELELERHLQQTRQTVDVKIPQLGFWKQIHARFKEVLDEIQELQSKYRQPRVRMTDVDKHMKLLLDSLRHVLGKLGSKYLAKKVGVEKETKELFEKLYRKDREGTTADIRKRFGHVRGRVPVLFRQRHSRL